MDAARCGGLGDPRGTDNALCRVDAAVLVLVILHGRLPFLPLRLLLLASFRTDCPDTVGFFTGVGICGVCLGVPWAFFMGPAVGLRVLWLIPAVSGRPQLR